MNERMMRAAEAKMAAAEKIRQRLAAAPPELSPPIEEELDRVFFEAHKAVKAAIAADPDEEQP